MDQEYKGYSIYSQAGDFFPIKVTFLRPDGYLSSPRGFKTLEDAKAWCEFMEEMELANE